MLGFMALRELTISRNTCDILDTESYSFHYISTIGLPPADMSKCSHTAFGPSKKLASRVSDLPAELRDIILGIVFDGRVTT